MLKVIGRKYNTRGQCHCIGGVHGHCGQLGHFLRFPIGIVFVEITISCSLERMLHGEEMTPRQKKPGEGLMNFVHRPLTRLHGLGA